MSSVCLKATNGKIDEQTIKDCFKIATISYEKVKELYNIAWANAVDVDFNSNTIIGNTTAIDGEKLFVNYIAIDGYKCKINGNNAKLIDNPLGFLCVELDAGDNQLKLKYSSPYVTYILLGIVVATLFAVAVMLAFKHYTKVKKSIELIADWGADLLAAFIFGFGFCYPFFLFLVKLFKLIFKL